MAGKTNKVIAKDLDSTSGRRNLTSAGVGNDHKLSEKTHSVSAESASGAGDGDVVARRSARLNADRLTSESDILREAVEQGGLQIVTAFFHFTTGAVEFD